jgi:hypothetical protein
MSSEIKKEIELEIAYVLFVDIVGYSKLLINEQRRLLELLNGIVSGTDQFKKAEANHRLITIPTGDGMRWSFTTHRKRRWNARSRLVARLRNIPSSNCAWVCTAVQSAA